jgi:hypothetical protein
VRLGPAVFSIAVLLACALPSTARAQRIAGELRAGGGYDSNALLATDPADRRSPNGRAVSPEPDGFFRAVGYLGGTLAEGDLSLAARLDLDGRVYGSGALIFWEQLQITGAYRQGDFELRCSLAGARLDASQTDDDGVSGELACGVRAELPLGFFASLDGAGALRAYDIGQLDGIGAGYLGAGWRHEWIAVELALSALRRESDNAPAARTELGGSLGVRLDGGFIGGSLGYRLVGRLFDSDARSGWEQVVRAEIWGMPLDWIGAYAEVEYGYADGRTQALAYERIQVAGGLRVRFDHRVEAREEGPAAMDEGAVRFSFDLPNATSVAVLGDWNDWDAARGELSRAENGRFEGRFQLASGRHEYHLLVDGEPVRPPGARRFVSDDFGGENAVIEVP